MSEGLHCNVAPLPGNIFVSDQCIRNSFWIWAVGCEAPSKAVPKQSCGGCCVGSRSRGQSFPARAVLRGAVPLACPGGCLGNSLVCCRMKGALLWSSVVGWSCFLSHLVLRKISEGTSSFECICFTDFLSELWGSSLLHKCANIVLHSPSSLWGQCSQKTVVSLLINVCYKYWIHRKKQLCSDSELVPGILNGTFLS